MSRSHRPKPEPPVDEADVSRFVHEVTLDPYHRHVNERLENTGGKTIAEQKTWSLRSSGCTPAPGNRWSIPPHRQQLHDGIVRALLNLDSRALESDGPHAILILGGPGSGKTTALDTILKLPEFRDLSFTQINSDIVKEALDEYRGWNAGLLHRESQLVANLQLLPQAILNRCNLILDRVGSEVDDVLPALEALKNGAGYQTYLLCVDVPLHISIYRAWDRFAKVPLTVDYDAESGRFVPLGYAYDVGRKPIHVFDQIKEKPCVDRAYVVHNATTLTPA